ncbi:MAG TPA: glycosyltransferase, partial [Bryobacteraceae bacterium]|nr:glycosyltransferase [Bryobacteraceae bacterium]
GDTLRELREKLLARRVRPLYGSVDPEIHRPVRPMRTPAGDRRIDLSYLGTYAADRQAALEKLFLDPAQRSPDRTFLIGGSLYPPQFPWKPNIYFVPHVPPADHNAFYCSSGLTLNVTRQPMADSGYCPSGRIFEAAACGVPVLSDWWEGLDEFFEPGREILVARSPEDTMEALNSGSDRLREIGLAARERALDCHTATIRAGELIAALEEAASERGAESVAGGEAH